MQAKLTDQGVVAVALASVAADRSPTTIAHLLAGLATEAEGRAGVRLRQRATAAATLQERAGTAPAPPMEVALRAAMAAARGRMATTVDLLDAAVTEGGQDVADLLAAAGYSRDLDGWLAGDPGEDWYEHPETFGFVPGGDAMFDTSASRIVAQVRAVHGGAVELLIAVAAAPDADVLDVDPAALAGAAAGTRKTGPDWDAGLDAVIEAAHTLASNDTVSVRDLVTAALVAGGLGPKLALELAETAL